MPIAIGITPNDYKSFIKELRGAYRTGQACDAQYQNRIFRFTKTKPNDNNLYLTGVSADNGKNFNNLDDKGGEFTYEDRWNEDTITYSSSTDALVKDYSSKQKRTDQRKAFQTVCLYTAEAARSNDVYQQFMALIDSRQKDKYFMTIGQILELARKFGQTLPIAGGLPLEKTDYEVQKWRQEYDPTKERS